MHALILSRIKSLPNYQQDQGNQPEGILVAHVLRFDTSIGRTIVTLHPAKLGPDKQNKTKEESCQESSNMGKVVHVRENPDC